MVAVEINRERVRKALVKNNMSEADSRRRDHIQKWLSIVLDQWALSQLRE